jgi:hypothetical protein
MGKTTINWPFSIAMLVYQRVIDRKTLKHWTLPKGENTPLKLRILSNNIRWVEQLQFKIEGVNLQKHIL